MVGTIAQPLWRSLPPPLEYRARAWLGRLGEPFNGQQGRIGIFRDLLGVFKFAAIIETGANLGSTTEFFASVARCPVWTCESDSRRAAFCKFRLRHYPHVSVLCGNSTELLRSAVLPRVSNFKGAAFCYLDAHWYDHLPLADEMAAIRDADLSAVIMIDDFEVPDDPGYGFDDYGPGKRLDLSYLLAAWPDLGTAFFPRLKSAAETGFKRGCVVLASTSELTEELAGIPSLRPAKLSEQRAAARACR